jgi:hypothetical protein
VKVFRIQKVAAPVDTRIAKSAFSFARPERTSS